MPLPPDSLPAEGGSMTLPPPGPPSTGIIAFAGRQVPLPAGNWQTLAIARDNGAVSVQVKLLARIEARHTTGLLLLEAPDPVNGASAPQIGNAGCFDPAAIDSALAPPPADHNPIINECWTLTPISASILQGHAQGDEIFTAAFARLAQYGADVPKDLIVLRYARSNLSGWLRVQFLAPDHPARRRALGTWARRYAVELHRGFSSVMTPKEIPGAIPRDPQ
jgi:hypothetical protein